MKSDKISLTQTIYQYLWNEISTLHLAPGEKLSEVKLANDFNCSRIPVREAVHLLVADDALMVKPQSGSFVTLIDLEKLAQVRYLRETLESKIILDGFQEGKFSSIVPYLESIIEKQRMLLNTRSFEAAFQLDIQFHEIFYNLTDKNFVIEHTGENNIHYIRARLLSLQLENPQEMPDQHEAIVRGIKNNDFEALKIAVADHLRNVNKVYKSDFSKVAEYIKA
ncbi:MAG: GntR family transcriptional regulator [Lachnospiraceae bacterium]|nr:GntR family transcriptional regulator [Lachnospiraceae bacterium]